MKKKINKEKSVVCSNWCDSYSFMGTKGTFWNTVKILNELNPSN